MPAATNIHKVGQAANFVWGLPNDVNITTYGRVQSFRSNRTSDKEQLKDGEGNTDGVIYYDKRREGSLEAILPTAAIPSLEIANNVAINGDRYYIEGYEKNWTAGAWAKVTLTLNSYDGVAAGSST